MRLKDSSLYLLTPFRRTTAAKASLPLVPESIQTIKADGVNLADKMPKKERKQSDGGGGKGKRAKTGG